MRILKAVRIKKNLDEIEESRKRNAEFAVDMDTAIKLVKNN